MSESIWNELETFPQFPTMDGNLHTDVLIVGGGLAGLLCAYSLRQRGADCILIEADRICSHVTGNTTAKITSQHGLIYSQLLRKFGPESARLYWKANEDALKRYQLLSQEIDCDFTVQDNYIYAKDSLEKLKQELYAMHQIGIPGELTEQLPLPISVAGAVRLRNQAQFHPRKFAAGIVRELPIYENTRAFAFKGKQTLTNRGNIYANKIIIATHFPLINLHGGYFLRMYQQRSYVLALENAGEVDGMYLDAAQNGLSFRNYGKYLLLGGCGHRTGKQGGGRSALEDFARLHYPEAKIVSRWATQDCMTLDGMPYIGRYARSTPDLFVATGFNKWGMTTAMVSAGILCDLVQGNQNPYAAVFSPQRSSLHPQLAWNAIESTVNLLTPTRPRCPHLGCALKWNPQEHSWDCSCHGSRFSESGELLENPANGNLKKNDSAHP